MTKLLRHNFFPDIDVSFLDISKNASTNIKRKVMEEMSRSYGYSFIDFNERPDRVHETAAQFLEHDPGKFKGKEVVAIFRDPVSRVVSAFANKYILKNPMQYTRKFAGYKNGKDMIQDFTFEKFCAKIDKSNPSNLNGHWMPQGINLDNRITYRVFDINQISNNDTLNNLLKVQLFDKGSGIGYANSSQYASTTGEYLGNVPLVELKRQYKESGVMPSEKDLVSLQSKKRLMHFYRGDYKVYNQLGGSDNFVL